MRIGIIGGSGLEERLAASGLIESARFVEVETPFGAPSAPLAMGRLARGNAEAGGESGSRVGDDREDSVELVILRRHGAGHVIPPHRIPHRANLFAMKSLGVTHIVATGAVGSLRETIHPGGVVLVDQFIDRTSGAGTRGVERTFFDQAAVHVEFADPCCPVLRAWLRAAATRAASDGRDPMTLHARGTCVVIDGPAFSTRAESHMHRLLGGDVVGMTALPEARLAREAEIAYALIALPTDFDCWRSGPPREDGGAESGDVEEHRVADHASESLLAEIIGNLNRSADAAVRLIELALSDLSLLRERPSPAHDALRLGIWTPKALIPREEVERLRVIWGRWM